MVLFGDASGGNSNNAKVPIWLRKYDCRFGFRVVMFFDNCIGGFEDLSIERIAILVKLIDLRRELLSPFC